MMEEVYVHALDLIRSAGMLVKANLVRRDKHVETKEGGRTDVVTETDKAVEKMFIEGIKYASVIVGANTNAWSLNPGRSIPTTASSARRVWPSQRRRMWAS